MGMVPAAACQRAPELGEDEYLDERDTMLAFQPPLRRIEVTLQVTYHKAVPHFPAEEYDEQFVDL